MKRKGFTLVELLAVIVILSVISIITIPIIGNVIEESKKKALEQSVRGLVESANYYSINNEGTYEFLFDENHKGETVKGESLDYNGSIDAEGKLYLDKEGNVSICVYNDTYYAYKNYNSGIVVGNRKEDNCNIGYDVISNKYVAFLESEGMSSNVYSKEEVNNIIDGVENKITINTNEITNIKGTIETLQSSLSNYALQSSLDTTNSNLDSLSSIVSNNQNSINKLNNDLSLVAYTNKSSLTNVWLTGYAVIGHGLIVPFFTTKKITVTGAKIFNDNKTWQDLVVSNVSNSFSLYKQLVFHLENIAISPGHTYLVSVSMTMSD